ncbi:hypothetical protein GF339_22365 [candidate division KSB3 bacterium]|uniref:Cell shape determination protein CcmA n=1 Tax=candidate division KSB3 bacterium TaxID=2044937 RepID=A0A9D5JZV6_9BACT|nr:hypothetical protein [candidate division KSB3 bacterium]MBD3327347.1 hypothetical protein [candidate division KSB3 bacterium]
MSILGHGLVITGDIFGEIDLVIRGVVKGSIFLQNSELHIDQTGYVEGQIRADKIVIAGEVFGDVTAETTLQLTPTSKVHGNIRTSKLAMAEEAYFNGGLTIQEPAPVELEIQDFHALSEDDYSKLRRWRMRNNID